VTIESLFATRVYRARLPARGLEGFRGLAAFNAQLARECRQLRRDDAAGRRWSSSHYPGGYTSYGSAHKMHTVSPTFALLQRRVARHVAAFAQALGFDLPRGALEMTDCWVNIMGRRGAHGLHLHPASSVSGSYYVEVPPGAPGLKLEDPRLDRMMAAPPLRRDVPKRLRPWVTLTVKPGDLVLFESFLRHEVPANPAPADRISISFNFSWF
jgi:uncharacterized protein (TIGR02466 family)